MRTTDKGVLGMTAFLASEAVFFTFLIIAYVYFSGAQTAGPSARTALDPKVTAIYTIALIASSVTIWRAGVVAKRRQPPGRWILASAVLGMVFLAGQGREYARLLANDVTISRDIFGTTFFTLTGFHGFHVLVGVLLLAIVWLLTIVDRQKTRGLDAVALYWHFVDVVWILIFAIVYIRPFV
jgi:heme/copper-type cytochrome/quinol oxidase subunit 3